MFTNTVIKIEFILINLYSTINNNKTSLQFVQVIFSDYMTFFAILIFANINLAIMGPEIFVREFFHLLRGKPEKSFPALC